MDKTAIIGIVGIVVTAWVSCVPMLLAAWGFLSKTKSAINGFDIHLNYFREKFESIIKDIESLQREQKSISEEIAPVKKNGSIVTSDELDRRMASLKNEIKQVNNTLTGEFRILAKIIENINKDTDIDHKYIEKKVIEIMKDVRDGMLP